MKRLLSIVFCFFCSLSTLNAAKEIEIKMCDNDHLSSFKNWVTTHGTLTKQVTHKECYFNAGEESDDRNNMYLIVGKDEQGSHFVKLLTTSKTYQSMLQTTVDDAKTFFTILEELGFNETVKLTELPEAVQAALPKKATSLATYKCSDVAAKDFLFKSKQGFTDTKHTLRIRRSENKGQATFKVCLKRCHSDATHRDEYETTVGHGPTMEKIIESLGYTKRTYLQKERTLYYVSTEKNQDDKNSIDSFEVVFDNVNKLGKFVEVELKGDIVNVPEGQQRLYKFLRDAQLKDCTVYTRNYFHMALNKSSEMFTRTIKISDLIAG